MAKPLLNIGKFGRALGEFNEPSGITKDGDDVILIADSRNDRIQVGSRVLYGVTDCGNVIIRAIKRLIFFKSLRLKNELRDNLLLMRIGDRV